MTAGEVSRFASIAVKWSVFVAVIAAPLAFSSPDSLYGYSQVPKVAALRMLAAFITVPWAAELLAGGVSRPTLANLYRSPAKWPALLAAGFLAANVVSALASISVRGSVFGPYPGYDGYDLVSTASLFVVGAAAATHLRSRSDFMHLLTVIAAAGTIAGAYGIFQSLGLDPFHFERFEVNSSRAALTFGNPLFAGSFLVISLVATAALVALAQQPTGRLAVLTYVALVIQAGAMAATVSRGPWIAVAAGIVGLAVLLVIAGKKGALRRILAAFVIGALGALAIFLVADGEKAAVTAERLESVSTASVSGLNGRVSLWQSGVKMGVERPWLDDGVGGTVARHLFGYGPDMYRFAFPLMAPSEHAQQLVAHPHNTFLLAWNELGLFGLAAWVGLTFALLISGLKASMGRSGLSPWARMLSAAITATLSAHFINMLVSVPRAGDQVVMWALIGALVAVLASGRQVNDSTNESRSVELANQSCIWLRLAPAGVLSVAAVAVLAMTALSTWRHIGADASAAGVQAALATGSSSVELMAIADSAHYAAPEVGLYSLLEAEALSAAADRMILDPARQNATRLQAIYALESAARANPVGHAERLQLARANYTMVTSGSADRLDETVSLYEDLVFRLPNFWPVWMEMAAAYALADQPAKGRAALERAEYLLALPEAYLRDDPASRRNMDTVAGALVAAEARLATD